MLPAAVQILAVVLALLGVLGAAVATLLPNWKVSVGGWTGPPAPLWHTQGLWMDCVWLGTGAFSCTMKATPLRLAAPLQASRAAMVLGLLLASFALCLAALGLKCTRWGGSRRAKGHTAMAAGACLVLSSLLCLGSASWFTSDVIGAFLTSDLPDNVKFQPGGALALTFVSAGFLLAGGVILCMSWPGRASTHPQNSEPRDRCPPNREERPPPRQNKSVQLQTEARTTHSSPRKPKDLKDSYVLQEYV